MFNSLSLYEIKIGGIYGIRKSFIKRTGIHEDFIKNGKRPFVVAEINENVGAIWLVPSFSNSENNNNTVNHFFIVSTPNGEQKYLDYRNIIVITVDDILCEFKATENTISPLKDNELKNFLIKYRSNKRYLRKHLEKAKTLFKDPFGLELNIMKKYLTKQYKWLERDYNIVSDSINFSIEKELSKFNDANLLYKEYINNLKKYRISLNEYIPIRKELLLRKFFETKIVSKYICLTNNGYIKTIFPDITYTDHCIDSTLLSKEELNIIKEDCIFERRNILVKTLETKGEVFNVLEEIVWLDYNIVSQKTFYDVYHRSTTKKELKLKYKEYFNRPLDFRKVLKIEKTIYNSNS